MINATGFQVDHISQGYAKREVVAVRAIELNHHISLRSLKDITSFHDLSRIANP